MPDDFKVSTKASAPGDKPVGGEGGFLPVYGSQKVQEMRKRSLDRMAAEKEANKKPTVSRSMSKR